MNYGFEKYTRIIRYKDYNPRENIKELAAKYKRLLGSFPS